MNLQMKGPDGVANRMAEIQARMAERMGVRHTPRKIYQAPEGPAGIPNQDAGMSFDQALQGQIGGGLAPMQPAMGRLTPATTRAETYRPLIAKVAEEVGVDPALLEALVSAESDFNPEAVSPVGARGLTQLMPATAKALGVTNPSDPEQSLRGGAKYLRQMLAQFGDIPTALAAYNAGPGAVRRYGGIPPFAETQAYVKRIQDRYGLIAGGTNFSGR